MSLKKNLESNIAIQIFNMIISFFTSVIVVRGIGVVGQGAVSYFILVFVMISDYAHLGINNAAPYFLKKSNYDEEYIYCNNISYFILNGLLIGVIIIISRCFNVVFIDYSLPIVIYGCLSIIILYLNNFLRWVYITREEIRKSNKCIFISRIIKVALFSSLFLIRKISVNSIIISNIIVYLSEFLLLKKNIMIKYKFIFDIKVLKKEFRYGIIVFLASVFISVNYRVDQLFIKFYLGEYSLGLYSVAVYLAELLFVVPNSIGSILMGRLANIKNDFKEFTSTIIKATFYCTLILSFLGVLCTPLVPIVYGKDYITVIPTIIILFSGIIFASMGKAAYSYFMMKNKVKKYMYICFVTMLFNVILNIILIPYFKLNGAAVASSLSYILYGIMFVSSYMREEKVKFNELFKPNVTKYKGINKTLH